MDLEYPIKKIKESCCHSNASWICELGSVSACFKLWFLTAFVFLDGLEGIFWFCNPLLLFLNCGFYVLHRKLFSITSPKKDFCVRGARRSLAAISVFDRWTVWSVHYICSQIQVGTHNLLCWIFFFFLQNFTDKMLLEQDLKFLSILFRSLG